MQRYDAVLKSLLRDSAKVTLRELTGVEIVEWRNVELPEVQNLRADMIGIAADKRMVQLELQSGNDPEMGLRLVLHGVGAYKAYKQFPKQVVLYVGDKRLSMPGKLRLGRLALDYDVFDVRDLDSDKLLVSEWIGDNVIGLLSRWRGRAEAVRRVLRRIAEMPAHRKEQWLRKILILADLRGLAGIVEREVKQMPILKTTLEHPYFGREYKRGRKEGREEGRKEGSLRLVTRAIERRFGKLPAWAEERLGEQSLSGLEKLNLRLFEVKSLKELFG